MIVVFNGGVEGGCFDTAQPLTYGYVLPVTNSQAARLADWENCRLYKSHRRAVVFTAYDPLLCAMVIVGSALLTEPEEPHVPEDHEHIPGIHLVGAVQVQTPAPSTEPKALRLRDVIESQRSDSATYAEPTTTSSEPTGDDQEVVEASPETPTTEEADPFGARTHACDLCETSWPTQARLQRHREMNHVSEFESNADIAAEAEREEQEARERLRAFEPTIEEKAEYGVLPVWEREKIEPPDTRP